MLALHRDLSTFALTHVGTQETDECLHKSAHEGERLVGPVTCSMHILKEDGLVELCR